MATTAKKQRCKKGNVFPCKTRCVPRRHWKSGKEQQCRNVAEGEAKNFLEWAKQQGAKKKTINVQRKAEGKSLVKSDKAGYLVEKDGTDYKEKADQARAIAAKTKDPKTKTQALVVAEKFDALATQTPKKTVARQQITPSINQNRITSEMLSLSQKYTPQQLSSYTKSVNKILNSPDTKLFIAIGSEAVENILIGGMKNRFEIEDEFNIGRRNPKGDRRMLAEQDALGIPIDNSVPSSSRPIYGYVDQSGDMTSYSHRITFEYGNVKLQLSDAVKKRATVTLGDSLQNQSVASSFNSPSPATFFNGEMGGEYNLSSPPKNIQDIVKDESYLEFQAYGGITAKDIDAIYYTIEPTKNKDANPNEAFGIPKQISSIAKKNNIKIFVNEQRVN